MRITLTMCEIETIVQKELIRRGLKIKDSVCYDVSAGVIYQEGVTKARFGEDGQPITYNGIEQKTLDLCCCDQMSFEIDQNFGDDDD